MSLDDAQKEIENLSQLLADERETNTRLRERSEVKAYNALAESHAALAAEHERTVAENTRLASEVEFLRERACCVPVNRWGHVQACHNRQALVALNTPLVEALVQAEKDLLSVRAMLRDGKNRGLDVLWLAVDSALPLLRDAVRRVRASLEKQSASAPAVTGTTSDPEVR